MKFQLGEWTVEENANLLFQSDARVRIEKRVMAVLIELIAANGAVVTKDALLKAVWQGAIVSDHSVANAVSDLRRALGDDRRNPRYIETIPKRGYRLLVDVEELRHEENPDTVGARYVSAGACRTAVAVVGVFLCTAALIVWFWPGPPARRVLRALRRDSDPDPTDADPAPRLARPQQPRPGGLQGRVGKRVGMTVGSDSDPA